MRQDNIVPISISKTLNEKATELYNGLFELEKRLEALYSIDDKDADRPDPAKVSNIPIYNLDLMLGDCLSIASVILKHVTAIKEAL